MFSVLGYRDWDSAHGKQPKAKKINESLLSKFFGEKVTILRVCEKIKASIDGLSSEQADTILFELERKFGRGITEAIDNGWTQEDFDKNKNVSYVKSLTENVEAINSWVDKNLES